MATIKERTTTSGEKRFDVRIRMQGYPIQTATFKRKSDALNYIKVTEAAMLEGRHFKTELPPVFRLPKGVVHATSFSGCCHLLQFTKY